MNIITGTKVWELQVRGSVPPGLTDDQIRATVMANFAIVGGILATVKSCDVIVRDGTPNDISGKSPKLL